jgi:hypothetical protein
MESPLEQQWASFMAETGSDLDKEIKSTMSANAHLLDIEDGSHATWFHGQLGVLIVFGEDDVINLMETWDDAADGSLMAVAAMLEWLKHFVKFVTACALTEEDGPLG